MSAFTLFAISIALGIGVCVTRSLLMMAIVICTEAAFILKYRPFRGYRKAWMFVIYTGTMLPVHIGWLCPVLFLYFAYDAFSAASVFLGLGCLFSAEIITLLFLVHHYEMLFDGRKN